jgi:peptidase M48-like protein
MTARMSAHHRLRVASVALVTLALATASAQTKITAPKNKYKVQDDVKLGQEAAAEAKKELPMLNDDRVDQYIEGVGARLAMAIPPEFQHPEFKFTFDVVNQKDINAFALPGGPMFLNRGMMEASKSEAEMAGVMAHEISHVALRHGTAQAGKSTLPSILGTVGQIGGAILGGTTGDLLGLGSQIGAGAWMTKYSREYESQADILGAQILARAGYDPREMANMFKTIEAEGGGGDLEWLSSHPNPGNRYNAITKEAASLQIQGKADTSQFPDVQARLKNAGPSYTAEQIAKGQHKTGTTPTATAARTVSVDPPAAEWRTQSPASFLQLSVPSNWSQVKGATYAPQGAFFEAQNGKTSFTHGVQFGTAKGSGNLQKDTQALLNGFAQGNPQLRLQASPQRDTVSGRQALTTTLTNVSDVTGQPESVALTTMTLPDGTLFYMVGVAPQSEAATYRDAFQRVKQSVKIATR